MPTFTDQLTQPGGFCYLRLSKEDLDLWNFKIENLLTASRQLLFRAAARPHFDYFFKFIDLLSIRGSNLETITDGKYKHQLMEAQKSETPHEQNLNELERWLKKSKQKAVLVTNRQMHRQITLKADYAIILADNELFGNVEPVWRKLSNKLPASFDIVLLALGQEKFLIGPRLKLKYKVPVIDLGAQPAEARGLIELIKKFTRKFLQA